jgi:hypothetical protein
MSTLALLTALLLVALANYGAVNLFARLATFNGVINWSLIAPHALADKWTMSQVTAIYLYPYVLFVALWLFFSRRVSHPVNLPNFILLLRNWIWLILAAIVCVFPLHDIWLKTGLFYPLNWLFIPTSLQWVFAVAMSILFFFKLFRVSAMFSVNLIPPDGSPTGYHRKGIIHSLYFLWLIPWAISLTFIYSISGNHTGTETHTLFLSILIAFLINLPLITRYKVIVK